MSPGPAPRPLSERFWAKVTRADGDGCWEWQGGCNKGGYGRIYVDSERGPQLAHRVSWELQVGPIPAGQQVLHHCDNPPCVRPGPGHLYLGTDADNSRDRIARGRERKALGLANGRAKFSPEVVAEVRRAVAGGATQAEAGAAFGMHPSYVSRLCRGIRRAERR